MKKFLLLLISVVTLACITAQAQVGIGTLTPDVSAEVDITSSNRGFLPPRMTAVQRTSIAMPAQGLIVYDTDSTSLMVYDGSRWIRLQSQWTVSGNNISNSNSGNVGIGSNAMPGSKLTVDGGGATAITAAGNGNSLFNPVVNIANTGSSGIAVNVSHPGNSGTAINVQSSGTSGTALEVTSSNKAIIVHQGKSGFGVANPLEMIDVNGGIKLGNTSTNNEGTIRYNGTAFQGYTGGQWVTLAGTPTQWMQNGNDLTNANSGNVGIGTNPATNNKLDVASSNAKTVNITNTNAAGIAVEATSATGAAAVFNTTSGTGVMINTSNPTGKALVISSGKVGVGYLNPTEQVDVNGAIRIGSTNTANSGTIRYNGIDFQGFDGTVWKSFTDTGSSHWTMNGNNISNNNNGKVGIGTPAPQQALHVKGQVRIDTLTNGAGTDGVVTVDANGVLRKRPASAFGGSGNGWGLSGNAGTDSTNFIGTTDNQALRFKVNDQQAGLINNQTGNTAYGYQALRANTTGTYNMADGHLALSQNTTGSYNTASGTSALKLNTTGSRNTANGFGALVWNTTGSNNVAIGVEALSKNETGSSLVAVGDSALYNQSGGAGGNTAVGSKALFSNTSGDANTANGNRTLYSNTTGKSNTAIGFEALRSNITGDANTANGHQALRFNTTGAFNMANGHLALNLNTTGSYNTASGTSALKSNTTGNRNTANGFGALVWNTTGSNNVAIGVEALSKNETGSSLVAVGDSALYHQNGGSGGNTAVGSQALFSNTTGEYNTANGNKALYSNTTGNSSTATGSFTLYNNKTGGNNTANGRQALYYNTTGNNNTAVGNGALYNNTTGNNNTAIGQSALLNNREGSQNTALGDFANVGDNDLTNATAIGARSQVGASNSMVLGSIAGVNGADANTKVGIGTTTPQQALHVKGQVRIDTLRSGAASDSVVTVDANGVLRRRSASAFTGGNVQTLSVSGNQLSISGGNTVTLPGGSGPWTVNGNNIYNSNAGNTGVGTATPVAAFNIGANKTVLFGSDTLNTGVKMMWIPAKKAFRAGEISTGDDSWNTNKIGEYSFATGYNTLASGAYSTATGIARATASYATGLGGGHATAMYATAMGSSRASGIYSTAGGSATATDQGATAFGEQTQAANAHATASGYYSVASGQFSTAIGGVNYARGFASTVFGSGNTAKAYGGVVVGVFNDTTDVVADPNAYSMTDRIFQVANGYKPGLFSPAVQRNAITVLRNGNTGIGVLNPIAKLDIAGNIKIADGTQGAGKVLTSDANGVASWQTPAGSGGSGWGLNGNSGTNNTNFIGNTDAVDLVFKTNNERGLVLQSNGVLIATGSTINGTTPNLGAGSRMMWIPERGAFRAGTVTGTHWNEINTGYNSIALGYNAMAPGMGGVALGTEVSASGQQSISMGNNAVAGSSHTIALGHLVYASQPGSVVIGDEEFSNTLTSTAMNQMSMRFKGGYRLYTSSATTGGSALYAEYVPGGSSWNFVSDKRKKENFEAVDAESILQKAATIDVTTWNYIGYSDGKSRHYGPMAQDFFKAFGKDKYGTIGSDTTISSADFDAVNLIAIQALEKRTKKLLEESASLKAENALLKEQNEMLNNEFTLLKLQMEQQQQALESKLEQLLVALNRANKPLESSDETLNSSSTGVKLESTEIAEQPVESQQLTQVHGKK